ncbi:MAG: GntR family transcriptional regulator [Propionibacteriaceae bacterium]|jgi:DNA-binding GntR family transcriptional regulator|nr:GntR family transcriptional regulator [Propionibacteriaceae bacterium]
MTAKQILPEGRVPYQVAESLRAAFARGEFVPGQRLVEAELCERYGVGRATVREALRLLDGDGLVEVVPHRATRVRTLSLADAIQLAEVVTVVETLLSRHAALNATKDDITRLHELLQAMREAVKSFDPLGYSELSEELHRVVGRASRHQAGLEISKRLRLQLAWFHQRLSLQPGKPVETTAAHERLVLAIANGDADLAESIMREHNEAMVSALRSLEQAV